MSDTRNNKPNLGGRVIRIANALRIGLLLFVGVLALVGALVSSAVAAPTGTIFQEDFSGDLSKWNIWHHSSTSYYIGIINTDGNPPPCLLLDDRLNYGTYAVSKQTFNYVGKSMEFSADIKQGNAAFTDQRTAHLHLCKQNVYIPGQDYFARIGITGSSHPNPNKVYCRLLYEDNGTEIWEQSDYLPISNGDGWHNARISLRSNGIVDFYLDQTLVYTSTQAITSAYDGQAAVEIGRRKSLYDNVLVSVVSEQEACGKLLVRSHNGSDWDLYIMDEDGSNLVAIDTGPSKAGWGDFSPDGKTILYLTFSGSMAELYQVPVTGGTPSLVASSLTNQAIVRWGSTPDRFFYSVSTGGPCGSYDMETHKRTYTLDSEGFLDELVSDEIILSAKNVALWDINEDLNKMTARDVIPPVCWAPRSVMVTYDADGTNRHVLSATDDGKSEAYPGISPDGEYIVFMKSDSASGWQNPHNIYRIRWDGTEQERLTNYVGDYKPCLPVWRDNDSLFYSVSPTAHEENDVLRRYTISTGEDVVVSCDLPNCQPVDFLMVAPVIEAAVDIDPDVLNLESRGRWITCYIWLPEPYDVADVDPNTILLNGQVRPDWSWINEAEQMLMAKFPRSQVQQILKPGEVELTVTGELLDSTKFKGSDTIRVIDKGGKK